MSQANAYMNFAGFEIILKFPLESMKNLIISTASNILITYFYKSTFFKMYSCNPFGCLATS